MSRAIDADALMKAMYHRAFETDGDTMWQSGCWVRYRAIEQVVKEQPTVEPERKKGKWNFVGDQMFECTECGTCYTQSQFQQMKVLITDPDFPRFCPMCGADMREGAEQE